MNILIVEDEPFVARDIQEKLKQIGYIKSSVASNYQLAIDALDKKDFDLVLLDIDLTDDKNGIDIGRVLKERNIPFIYLTDMQDSITFSNAKKTDPIANLDKPVSSITLRNTIDRAFSQNQISTAKYIVVNSGSKKIKIDPESIYYLKAASSNCEIHLKETEGMKRYLASNPMGTVAHILPPNIYCQVHRSYIVNLNKVFAFQGNRIFMDKALTIEIPISPSYLSKFKSRFYSV